MAQDALDELRIGQPGLQRGQGKVFVGREDGIGIGLDEINLVVHRQAQVHARVAVEREQAVDAFAGLLNVACHGGIEIFGELVS